MHLENLGRYGFELGYPRVGVIRIYELHTGVYCPLDLDTAKPMESAITESLESWAEKYPTLVSYKGKIRAALTEALK